MTHSEIFRNIPSPVPGKTRYIVETFFCEYKLDRQRIQEVVRKYRFSNDTEKELLRQTFHNLYPEGSIDLLDDAALKDLPTTAVKKIYFVQSPKGSDGLPSIHYSLKEKLLSDFRYQRSKVKKDMADAERNGDKVSAVRFNAKQNAIKVVCNSEYGASNNNFFAHYDPDVAAAVTFAARALIAFLTTNLETPKLYVDEKFINDNRKEFDVLVRIKCVTLTPYLTKDPERTTYMMSQRRHALRRLYDESYNVIANDIIEVNIQKSTVVYQDTDSNYYINEYITDYFTKSINTNRICNPEIIDKCMHAMLDHNNLMANFAKETVERRPIGLGFEGSFIVCRYLNRKKKYYGTQWSPDGSRIPSMTLCDKAYTDNIIETIHDTQAFKDEYMNTSANELRKDYLEWWSPKKSVLPMPNGEYIYLDADKLLNKGVNYLDYVKGYGTKCTGVDLARRDQYKFINYYHIAILQKDLRLMKYTGENQWNVFAKEESMQTIVENVIESFRDTLAKYSAIAQLISDVKPTIEFKIGDFAKNAAYRIDKQNVAATIVARLRSEHKEQYIPVIGERMYYVVLLDNTTESARMDGRKGDASIATRSYVVNELLDDMRKTYPETSFVTTLNITYDEWLQAKVISRLDMRYYLECLCKSTALYIVGDLYPTEIEDIDNGTITQTVANALITKLQQQIADVYVKKYFKTDRSISTKYKSIEKRVEQRLANEPDGLPKLLAVFNKTYPSVESLNKMAKLKIIKYCDNEISRLEEISRSMERIHRFYSTNSFTKFYPANDNERTAYAEIERRKLEEPDSEPLETLFDEIVNIRVMTEQWKDIKNTASELTFE